jgi:ABC-type bacteriocin/lantibiotic exporter with double-glycine peptidase domain
VPVRPPYYKQETEYSCMVACLRMVLEHLGVVRTEKELRVLTDSDFDSPHHPGGTEARHVVDAARELGFVNTNKNNLTLQELVAVVIQGRFPIVQIGIGLPPSTLVQPHAVVIVKINERGVLMLDPARGEIVHTQEEFDQMWRRQRGLTILIE